MNSRDDDKESVGSNPNGAGPWGGFGSSGGKGVRIAASAGKSVVSAGLKRSVGESLLAGIGRMFSTGTGMVAVAGIVGSAATFTLWNVNHSPETGEAFDDAQSLSDARIPGGRRSRASDTEALRAPTGGKDSLDYLAQGNDGLSPNDGGQPVDAAAQAQAASAALEAAQRGSGASAPDNANAPTNTNAPANTSTPGLTRNVGQLTTNISGDSGSTPHSGIFAGGAASGGSGHDAGSPAAKAAAAGSSGYGAASAASANTAPRTPVLARSSIQRAGGNGAMGQLQAASSISRGAAMAESSEGQSYGATRAFEGTAALGSSGGTIGNGGTGVGSNGGTGMGVDNGGPVNLSKNDTQQQPQSNVNGQNVTPWQGEATTATIMLIVAGLLLLAAKLIPNHSVMTPYRKYLALGAAILGGVVVALGVNIMTSYNQMMQGGVLAAAGGVVGVMAGIIAVQDFFGNPADKIASTAIDAGKMPLPSTPTK